MDCTHKPLRVVHGFHVKVELYGLDILNVQSAVKSLVNGGENFR